MPVGFIEGTSGCGSFLLVPLGFTENNQKIHVLIKKELNKKLDEGPSEPDKESNEESELRFYIRLFIRLWTSIHLFIHLWMSFINLFILPSVLKHVSSYYPLYLHPIVNCEWESINWSKRREKKKAFYITKTLKQYFYTDIYL